MRQTSSFTFEAGTSRRSCLARWALRILVSRSAIGSVIDIGVSPALPAGLDHARQIALQREQPEADAAEPELAQEGARPAAALAAVAVAHRELGLLEGLGDFGGGGHSRLSFTGPLFS